MNEDMFEEGLTDEQMEDFYNIICNVTDMLVQFADKNNIDRDDFAQYFAEIFMDICDTSTFKFFGNGVAEA